MFFNRKSSKHFNIGIVGTGDIATVMVKSLRRLRWSRQNRDIRVYAVTSNSEEQTQAFAKKWSIKIVYSDYADMLSDPNVDMVYLAVPNNVHFELAKMALEHDKPCLVEKPFTINAQEAEELIRISQTRRVFLAEAIVTRYLSYHIIKDILDKADLGSPRLIHANLCYWKGYKENALKPETGGGALLDFGVYCIGFARMLIGTNWKSVKTSCIKNEYGADEIANISMISADDVIANLHVSICSHDDKHGVICCRRGYMEIDDFRKPSLIKIVKPWCKSVKKYRLPKSYSSYNHIFIACRDSIANHCIENQQIPHSETLEVMRIMDSIRQQWSDKTPIE